MLIPGFPVVNAQPDSVKPKRGVQPTVKAEVVHESDPQPIERRRRDKGRYPERRRGRRKPKATVEYTVEGVLNSSDMSPKGLLVDIEV